jgi:hypothetical protein
MPTTRRSLRSSVHLPHKLSSAVAGASKARMVPTSAPLTSRMSTTAVGLPSASLIVVHAPTGVGVVWRFIATIAVENARITVPGVIFFVFFCCAGNCGTDALG